MSWRQRILVLLGAAALVAAGLLAYGPIAQDQAYHAFAGRRPWLGMPNAADVLSNLGFLAAGLWGLFRVERARACGLYAPAAGDWPYRVFFVAVTGIAAGSSWYHLAPDDGRLVWDRLPMTAAFAAGFAAVVADRIDDGVGNAVVLPAGVLLGFASLWLWAATGDLRPYVLVQFAPFALIPLIAVLFPAARRTGAGRLAAIAAAYALAKAFELADGPIHDALGVVGGHTLKHLAAAAACALVVPIAAGPVRSPS